MSAEGAGYFIIINVKYSQSSWGRAAPAEATRNVGRGGGNVCEINASESSDLATRSRARCTFPFLISSAISENGPYIRNIREAHRVATLMDLSWKKYGNSRGATVFSCVARVAETRCFCYSFASS